MTTVESLSAFKGRYAELGLRFVAVRLAWVALALLAAIVIADALFALGSVSRLAAISGVAACLVGVALATGYLLQRSRSFDRMVARLIEESDPKLGNKLVNALDFTERLEDAPSAPGEALMRAEIAQANRLADSITSLEALRPRTHRAERRVAYGLGGAALIGVIAFWPVVSAVTPRLLFPFADFPPYSPTKFAVAPGPTELHYGDDLKVTVNAAGKIPKEMELVLWNQSTGKLATLPMFNASQGEFFQTIENVRDDVRYFARAGRGRSKRFPITVIKEPQIESVVVDYVYPEYTRRASETRTLSDGTVRGYRGTEVTFTVHSNRPLASGTVHAGGGTFTLERTEDEGVQGSIRIGEAGTFSIDVTDVDGNLAEGAAHGTVTIIPDTPPEVAITAPGMDSFAVPDAKVPIEVSVVDDLGISGVALFRNHNASRDFREALYDRDEGRASLTVVERLDLGALGVRPGDVIEYYATARDNLPGAPQTSATPAFKLQIISHEQYRDYMQTQMTATDLREQYDAILDELRALAAAQKELAEHTEALGNAMAEGSAAAESQERLAELQAQQQQLAAAARAMAEELRGEAAAPAIYDIENSYKQALADFAERVEQAAANMESAQGQMAPPGSGVPSAVSEQREALRQLGAVTNEFQNGIQQANRHLENVMNLISDVENFKYLYSLQKGLERQIRYYSEASQLTLDDQIRLKELSERQEEVREALAQLKEDLRDHAEDLDALAEEQQATEEPVP